MWIQVNPIHHNGSQTEEGGGGWGGGLWFMERDEEIEPINLLGLIQLEGKYNKNILEYNL